MQYTITKNEQYNSVEISFTEKPSEAVREALKAARFRWHNLKKVWYGYGTEEAARAILEGSKPETEAERKKQTAPVAKKNKFGVKVGDLFSASWGYDQTNVDFFQVVELVGELSVRVREVYPPMIEESGITWGSADRTYKTSGLPILPPAPHSVFIRDQERGDLKRLKSYRKDGSCPQFYLDSFADAYFCGGETEKHYESWYA